MNSSVSDITFNAQKIIASVAYQLGTETTSAEIACVQESNSTETATSKRHIPAYRFMLPLFVAC